MLKVKAKGHRDLVTVVGSLASVSPGEWLTAQGRWLQDREFGQQFKTEMLTSTTPTTREGIEKYLGSGMVIRELNVRLQNELNPARAEEPVVEKFGWQFRVRDEVMQVKALACELPAQHDAPLSRWSVGELTRRVCQSGLVAQLSETTVRR